MYNYLHYSFIHLPLEECRTVKDYKCVLPFEYEGITYNSCITHGEENGLPWCYYDWFTELVKNWDICDNLLCPVHGGKQ